MDDPMASISSDTELTVTDMASESGILRVMIVEDNQDMAQTAGWLVEALGYDYQLAKDAPDAIGKYKDYMPHVIMLDLGLPGMSGYELCEHLRKAPELSRTIFVAQTGWDGPEHRQKTQAAGFHHHMVKPVYIDSLQTLLEGIDCARKA
jgi:CheY-like chemotaxis protein